MKKCIVEIELDANNEVQKKEFGNRWINGSTLLILKPMLPWVGGLWDSDRQIDIDSAAGTDHAFFEMDSGVLKVKTGGYEGDPSVRTHLKLNSFTMKVGEVGDGTFAFRQRDWDIHWGIVRFD